MVHPGGKFTMLGHWRIVMKQAEEAARAGRFDEALALASRPDVADHHQLVQRRAKWAVELIARAARRGEADDLAAAIEDLRLAERSGAAPDLLAAARLRLADRVADEVRAALDAGDPALVAEKVDALAKEKIGGPSLRRTREIADAWHAALDEARRGEFGRAQDHLDRAERLAAGTAASALSAARRDLEAKQKAAAPRVEALYAALPAGKPAEVLAAAESVLEVVPEHPAARQARTRAWQQIAALSPSASWPNRGARLPQPPPLAETTAGDGPIPPRAEIPPIVWLTGVTRPVSPPVPPTSPPIGRRLPLAPQAGVAPRPLARGVDQGPKGRFLLWLDAIGGYLVCLDDQIVLGRAGHDATADVPLMGDLARTHATLIRTGEGYLIRAHHPTFLNGQPVESAPLHNGDVIRLGAGVELEFRQPSPVSATARLALVSRHRLPMAVDGVLLMAETCIVGGSPQAHIPAPALRDPVVLYRQGPTLWCRAAGAFEVDGRECSARAPLTLASSVLGDGFSFSLEAAGMKSV